LIPTSFGTLAVNVFFTISGLLLAKSYIERDHLVDFIRSRLLRIYPALVIAVLFTTFLVGLLFTNVDRLAYLVDAETQSYLLRNRLMVRLGIRSSLPGVFVHNKPPNAVNDPLWTLPYELRMYGLVALAGVLGLLRRRAAFNAACVAAVAALWMFHARGGAAGADDWLPQFERLGVFFLAGTACYINRGWVPIDWRVWGACVALAVLTYPTPWFMSAFWLALVYSIFAIAYLPQGRIRMFNRMGDYSYGLYVYGFPVQQAFASLVPSAGPWLIFAASMAVTLPLAVASWKFIEAPALSLKSHRTSRALRPIQVARA
jgi:peptidoglycan/LPS O-acetylase OafA/YrhL